MTTVSQSHLRRLAARSIRVLDRHKEVEPVLGAFVGSLDEDARAFIGAYDRVCASGPSRSARRKTGVDHNERLVKKLRGWMTHLVKDVPSFDRSTFLQRHNVTDDVISDAERMLAVLEDHVDEGGNALPYAETTQTDIEAAVELARSVHRSHNTSRAELTALLADARTKAEAFYAELVAFRRSLRVFLGSTHPDYHLLRNQGAKSGADDDGENDTIEDDQVDESALADGDGDAPAKDETEGALAEGAKRATHPDFFVLAMIEIAHSCNPRN